jgi:hypothetical protein
MTTSAPASEYDRAALEEEARKNFASKDPSIADIITWVRSRLPKATGIEIFIIAAELFMLAFSHVVHEKDRKAINLLLASGTAGNMCPICVPSTPMVSTTPNGLKECKYGHRW